MVNRRGGRGLPHGGFALAPAARNALGPRKPFGVSTGILPPRRRVRIQWRGLLHGATTWPPGPRRPAHAPSARETWAGGWSDTPGEDRRSGGAAAGAPS